MNTEMIICSEDIKICIEDQNFLKNVSINIKNIAKIQFENITGENVEKKSRKSRENLKISFLTILLPLPHLLVPRCIMGRFQTPHGSLT